MELNDYSTPAPKNKARVTNSLYYFSTRDLVIVAVLSALGGVMSAYLHYIVVVFNQLLILPIGAGQVVSGLHIFWIVLGYGLIRKAGTATLIGFIKGYIEFFSGNPHGVVVILVSLVEGLFFDLGMVIVTNKGSKLFNSVSAGFASASNIVILQILFFAGLPLEYLIVIWSISFISGIFFAGILGLEVLNLIFESNIIPSINFIDTGSMQYSSRLKALRKPRHVFVILIIVVSLFSFTIYSLSVVFPKQDKYAVIITGNVEEAYTFHPSDFEGEKITINAIFTNEIIQESAKDYTGVPVIAILNKAKLNENVTTIKFIGADGYSINLSVTEVYENSMILEKLNEGMRLVAGSDFPGSYWVRRIVRIDVK